MKYTQEEVKNKSNDKVKAVQVLLKQLKLEVSAEQMVNENGFIKQVVYFTDTEEYDIVEEDQIKLPLNDNKSNDEKYDDKTSSEDIPREEAKDTKADSGPKKEA